MINELNARKEKIEKAIENSDKVPSNIKKNLKHIVLEPEGFLLIEALKLYEECTDNREKRKLLELLTEIKKTD